MDSMDTPPTILSLKHFRKNFFIILLLNIASLTLLVLTRTTDWLTSTLTEFTGPLHTIQQCLDYSLLTDIFVWILFPCVILVTIVSFLDAFALTYGISKSKKRILILLRIDLSLVNVVLGLSSLFLYNYGCVSLISGIFEFAMGFYCLVALTAIQGVVVFYQTYHSVRKGFFHKKINEIIWKQSVNEDDILESEELGEHMNGSWKHGRPVSTDYMDNEFEVDVDRDLDLDESQVSQLEVLKDRK